MCAPRVPNVLHVCSVCSSCALNVRLPTMLCCIRNHADNCDVSGIFPFKSAAQLKQNEAATHDGVKSDGTLNNCRHTIRTSPSRSGGERFSTCICSQRVVRVSDDPSTSDCVSDDPPTSDSACVAHQLMALSNTI
jgi:hypothetical protein